MGSTSRTLQALCLLILMLSFAACAPRQAPVDPAMAGKVWQAMLAKSSTQKAPYLDNMSLRFGTEGNTRRVLAILWGNGGDDLRLDVQAGVGASVAMVRQQGSHFLLYAPTEQKAFFHEGATSPLLKLGLPLPFDLFKLEALLHNRWTEVFGSTGSGGASHKLGIAYTLEEGIHGTLVLDAAGMPAKWSNENWSIGFAFNDDDTLKRLDLANKKGDKGILLLRGQEHPAPFSDDKMLLELPKDTPLLPLDKLRK